ncbi:Qat anti-phage system TatD family nuclease QatD [Teredinibacter purpureus]|uniref:Qat anti-phage system TatD family nuclease QatD n=1 Tax=Teredinibacter purpureus TaxID=2731756 RepID=UPI0005F7C2EC
MVDMHCHLDLYEDPFAIAKETVARGVGILSVTTTPKAWAGTKKLEQGLENSIYTALGLHPQLAAQRFDELGLFDAILPTTPFVGEIGLDGGKGFKNSMDIQLKVFRHILSNVHSSGGRVMSIHSRYATEQVLDELKGIDGAPILHWFTGSKRQLRRAIDLGCWFSVGPNMISSKGGAELVRYIPLNRILLETDGPFCKIDGEILMPWDCKKTIDGMIDLLGKSKPDISQLVSDNFTHLKKLVV